MEKPDLREGRHAYEQRLLKDVLDLGAHKPMGNLPFEAIINICKLDVEAVEQEVARKGFKSLRSQSRPGLAHAALFAYDPAALSELLERKRSVLENAGWPKEPEEFVRKVAAEQAPGHTPLYDLIADAFGDTDDPSRS